MKYLRGPYVVGADATDLMGAPEGGRFVAIDAPAANHHAFAVVVVQLSDAEPTSESTQRLQCTAQLLAAAPDLLDALFGLLQYPSGQYSEGGDFDAAWDKAEKLAKQFGLEVN